MVAHRDRRTTKSVTRTPLRPAGYGGIGPSATLPLLDRWGDIDFVVPPRIRPNGARNAIPAVSCHGLINPQRGRGTPRRRSAPFPEAKLPRRP